MDRRSFLKLGSLFAAAMAVEASPILRAAANLAEQYPDLKVVLYLLKNKKGHFKVKATKYRDIPKRHLRSGKWDLDSFRILDIVDSNLATDRRNELWQIHNCKGKPPGWSVDIPHSVRIGKKYGKLNVENGHLDRVRDVSKAGKVGGKIGGKITGPITGRKNVENGNLDKARLKSNEVCNKQVYCSMTGRTWKNIKTCARDIDVNYSTLKLWLRKPHLNQTTIRI